MMFLTGRRVEEPDAKEPSKDEQKKEKEELDRSKKDKVPPPPPKFSARAKLVELALGPATASSSRRAIVNRIWHRLFGHGLVMPLDQMHSANPPSHPELLAWLARDMADHGYDLRRLIRGLVLSRGLCPQQSLGRRRDPPRPSLFAVALVRPLTPMQLATSLRLATADPASLPPDFESEPVREADPGSGGKRPPARLVVRDVRRRLPDRRHRGLALQQRQADHRASSWPTGPTGSSAASSRPPATPRSSTWPCATCSRARPTTKSFAP